MKSKNHFLQMTDKSSIPSSFLHSPYPIFVSAPRGSGRYAPAVPGITGALCSPAPVLTRHCVAPDGVHIPPSVRCTVATGSSSSQPKSNTIYLKTQQLSLYI